MSLENSLPRSVVVDSGITWIISELTMGQLKLNGFVLKTELARRTEISRLVVTIETIKQLDLMLTVPELVYLLT